MTLDEVKELKRLLQKMNTDADRSVSRQERLSRALADLQPFIMGAEKAACRRLRDEEREELDRRQLSMWE